MKNLLFKNKPALRALVSTVLLSFALPLLSLSANAQTTEPQLRQLVIKDKTPAAELPRLALVIGNAKYESITPLRNSSADATDMTIALKALGFEVISGIDQNKKQMQALIREFGDKLYVQKGIGLFFYAGHGVQSSSRNYLVPVDADIPREDEIDGSAVDMRLILNKFDTAKNDLSIIMLDACRNNPFAKEWSEMRAVNPDEGLAKINVPKGTLMFYATEPGKTASDGSGRNGLFTEVLLENIKKPNLELDTLLKVVSRGVEEKSKQLQRPYREGTVTSDFYFAASPVANPVLPSPVVKIADETEPEIKAADSATVERGMWTEVVKSTDGQDFRDFLQNFPSGYYSAQAKTRLEQLVWAAAKASNDKTQIQNYLTEFPNGASAPTARIKLRQIESRDKNVEPAKMETAKVETEKAEPVKTEPEESAPPVKKASVPKVETPKVTARTVKPKTKSAAELNKLADRKNSFGMDFVRLPAGSFMMGSSEANINESYALGRKDYKETTREDFNNEKSQHRVTFADGFWMGKTEVTQAQWMAVMGDNQSFFKNCDDCPVERVSWEDAKKFVEKLNAQNDGFEYRLPSEAEWEYAAHGGKTGILSVSAARIGDTAWYFVNSGTETYKSQTHPVGLLEPNAFGLYDMHGNVAEWCEDTYSENYENAPLDGSANMNGNPERRVLRGGYYNDLTTNLRLTRRDTDTPPKVRRSNNGLRVVAVEKK